MKLDEILIEEAEYQEAWKRGIRGRTCLSTTGLWKRRRKCKWEIDNVQPDKKNLESQPTAERMFLCFGEKHLSLSTIQRVTEILLNCVPQQAYRPMPFCSKPVLVHHFCCSFPQKWYWKTLHYSAVQTM